MHKSVYEKSLTYAIMLPMKLSDLLNKRIVVPVLNITYFGPTLAERTKKRDWGFNRTKKPTDK